MSQPAQSIWRSNVFTIGALVSLVIGIAAVVVGLFVSYAIGGILGLLAVFLGKVLRDLSKSTRERLPLTLAITGMVLGGVGVAMSAIGWVIQQGE